MRDVRKEQRSSSPKTESHITKYSRARLSSGNNPSKPNPVKNGNPAYQRREISPPPLKRKRTVYEESYTAQDPANLKTFGITNSNLRGQPIDVRNNRVASARPLQTLDSLQAPHNPHGHQARSRSVLSIRRTLNPSKLSSKPESCKPACRVCDKTTSLSYNPIIACPGCARPYHDSCRKPPLAQGVDPQHWRCFACLSRNGKPAKSMGLSKPVPIRGSVVRDNLKPPFAQNSIADSAKLSDGTALGKNVHAQTWRGSTASARWLGSLDRPMEDFESSLQSDRSENLSKPVRCSTQSPQFESSSQQHHVQAPTGLLASSPPVRVQNRTLMAPCSDCRQLSVFVRPGDDNPQCQTCQNEFPVEELKRLEIPETPHAAAHYDILSTTSNVESVVLAVPNSSTAESETCSWVGPARTSTLDTTSLKLPHDEQQHEKDLSKLDESETRQKHKLSAPVSSVIHETEEGQARISPQRHNRSSTNTATARVSYSEQQEFGTACSENSPAYRKSSVSPRSSASPEVDDASLHVCQRSHTNRELAIIALACANGSSMSAPQMIDWLVQRFSYLQQGQGSWKKSFKATLSLKEFRSQKATGLDDVDVLYKFADEAYKTRYEEEYRDYVIHFSHGGGQQQVFQPVVEAVTSNTRETVENMPEQHSRGHPAKTLESTPTRQGKDNRGNTSKCVASSQHSAASSVMLYTGSIPSPASTSSDDITSPNPFKLSRHSPARNTVEYAHGMKRETSFHQAYLRGTPVSIGMMTAEEKAKKVAEIRGRPSRKQLFDSGQRLAHTRRFRRQDPHDESEGVWKPQSVGIREKPVEGDVVANHHGEPRSLREVFGLPANAVPMLHEGNELAFRDGTMVNGRLPRPRQIYRVGKRLGAGLTVN